MISKQYQALNDLKPLNESNKIVVGTVVIMDKSNKQLAEVKDIIDGVAMILPWNTGSEVIMRVKNLTFAYKSREEWATEEKANRK